MDVSSTTAVITGGASGLGAAVARMVLDAGGRVAVLDRASPESPLAGAAADRAIAIKVDITDPVAVERAVDRAAAHFGRLDMLVGSAGVSAVSPMVASDGTVTSLPLFKRVVDVNLVGLYDVIRHCVRHFVTNTANSDDERGVIVNVASIAGIEGPAGQTAYAATKGAIIALTLPLARDLARWGIRVMTIAPGLMETPMLTGGTPERLERLNAIPTFPRRLGRPDELAQLVRQIAENRLLNGEVIRLDAATRLPTDAVVAG